MKSHARTAVSNLSEMVAKVEGTQEMHAIVSGRVQGVGFRVSVRYLALQLNLKGTVRNLPNGNVEILAQGKREVLDKLAAQLKRIPPPAEVASVKVEFTPPQKKYETFSILK